jgi:hypothetical protein
MAGGADGRSGRIMLLALNGIATGLPGAPSYRGPRRRIGLTTRLKL